MKNHDDPHPADIAVAVEPGIFPLKEMKDFQIAKGDPDVRGWEVLSNDGRRIGKVDDVLIDTAAMKVRYLDIDLDQELRNLAGEGTGPGTKRDNILIPIGAAHLHEKEDRVTVDLLQSLVSGIPTYERGTLTREHEASLRRHFDRDDRDDRHEPERDRDFYEHEIYDESRFYGPRRPRR